MPALKRLYKEKGTLGILEWIYDKKRFIFIKYFLKTIFLVMPYETILKLNAAYDNKIAIKGFSASTREYLSDLNIGINIQTPLETSGPALIFGNHPTGLDPFIIASCLNREDVYIVADIYQKNKGKNIGKQIIPITYARTKKNLYNRGFLNTIGFYAMRQLTGYSKPDEVRIQNKETIERAAQLLKDGHVVIIFPDGGSNNPELWYNGIGEIITHSSEKRKSIQLYAAQITGISTAKIIRHFLFDRRSYLKNNPLKVTLSQPFTLEKLNIENENKSNIITERLREEFITHSLWIPNYAYNKSS
ncbi:MAG: 1-acyl-sn-glycerol-3-phosphate acyltransferase [bacterium]|nr:1-acyl-sn-glycerol-3-phosphate acyltransferase [bacterium]